MQSILASVRPQPCCNIANEIKKYEIRTTRPNLNLPFKVFIYCTQSELLTKSHYSGVIYVVSNKKHQEKLERCGNIALSGKVIGEFICDEIIEISPDTEFHSYGYEIDDDLLSLTCLTREQLITYGKGKALYAWHISELKIYDKPAKLNNLYRVTEHCGWDECDLCKFGYMADSEKVWRCNSNLTRPPQSWCYVNKLF